jgi:uncharacterized protein YqjF (DUF2071 family)
MSFLKAEWRKLVLANYVIPEELLLPYVPKGTELDLWEGKCYVSLVGFLFKNTKVLGVKIPGHVNFEEVNLRFYVKRIVDGEVRRGVVFIKEIVPKAAITFVANTVYREHYVTKKMDHAITLNPKEIAVHYTWVDAGEEQSFEVIAEAKSVHFPEGSEEEFITEHYWGYSKFDSDKTNEYEVTHPKWQVYPVKEYEINVDFEAVYGADFAMLNQLEPRSVFLAEGSEITVESKNRLV